MAETIEEGWGGGKWVVTKQPTTTEDPARKYRKNELAQTQQNRMGPSRQPNELL